LLIHGYNKHIGADALGNVVNGSIVNSSSFFAFLSVQSQRSHLKNVRLLICKTQQSKNNEEVVMSEKSLKLISLISTMTLLLFLAGMAMAQDAAVEQGALAWNNWTTTDAGGSGTLPVGVDSKDYIRCKACHGWDRLGTDGGYVRRSRKDSRPNAGAGDGDTTSRVIITGSVTADMIKHTGTGSAYTDGMGSWVAVDATHSAANKAAHSNGYTLGNQHPDFSIGDLTQTQIDNLVAFLNFADADPSVYFSNINSNMNPALYTIVSTADAAAGETFYNSGCSGCHGDPASAGNVGAPDDGILAYLEGDGKFSELSHAARWGIPNTSMSRAAMGSPTSQNISDMLLYLKELGGTGFVINSGLSGNWWGGETRDGEGFLIDVAKNGDGDTKIVVSFYTYDSLGNQVWLIGSGLIDVNTAVIDLAIPSGAMWGAAFNPDDNIETPWGSGTFTFTTCGAGNIALLPNLEMQNAFFTDLAYAINRDILVPGVTCPK
jgi:cytochrome c553